MINSNNSPLIGVKFFVTGEDYQDFDLDEVTDKLCIVPVKTQKQETLKNGTLKPTYWLYSLPKENAFSIDDKLCELMSILNGKEDDIRELSIHRNLCMTIEISISAKCDELPEIFIPRQFVAFADSINAEIGVALYLDPDE